MKTTPEPQGATPQELLRYWSPRTATGLEGSNERLRIGLTGLYLSMRGLDEIEDHPRLEPSHKIGLLHRLVESYRAEGERMAEVVAGETDLPDVTMRIAEWQDLPPLEIRPRVDDGLATIGFHMAHWVGRNWSMETEEDLMRYAVDISGTIFATAGEVMAWATGVEIPRDVSVGAGVAAQLGNMARGIDDDRERGVDFRPRGWTNDDLRALAKQHVPAIDRYRAAAEPGPLGAFSRAAFENRY